MRHHAGEVELPAQSQRSELGELSRRIAGAVVRSLERLVREELDRRHARLHPLGSQSDDDDCATRPDGAPGEPDRVRPPDHLERVVDAAAGEPPDDADGSRLRGRLDRVGRALGTRQLELLCDAIDRDDRVCTGHPGAGDHLQTDAATAEHCDGLASAHACDVADGSHAGDDPTPEQRRLPER